MSVKKSQYSFEMIGMIAIIVVVGIVFMTIFYRDNPKDASEMNIVRQSVANIANYGQKVSMMGDGNRIKVGVEIPMSVVNVTFGTGYIQMKVETSKGIFDYTQNTKQHFFGYNFTSGGNMMNGVQEVYFEMINGSVCVYPSSMREGFCCSRLYRLPRIKDMGSAYSNANITCDVGSSLIDQPCNTQLTAGRTLTAINVRCIDRYNSGIDGKANIFMFNDTAIATPMINQNSSNFTVDGKFTYALSSPMLITAGHTYTINATCYDLCYEEVTPNTLLRNTTNVTKVN